MYLFLIKGSICSKLFVLFRGRIRGLSLKVEIHLHVLGIVLSVYIACHRNADRPLHLLQGWDEVQIRSRFHLWINVGSEERN